MKKGVIALLSGMAGGIAGAVVMGRTLAKTMNARKRKADSQAATMLFLNQWMTAKQAGKRMEDYFHKRGYKKILAYGMGYIGERFVDEMEESDVEIVAAMDRDAATIFADVPMIGVDAEIPEVDCIVVTPVFFYQEIYETLKKKTEYPIISIQDILDDM